MKVLSCRLEFEPRDLWVGVYWTWRGTPWGDLFHLWVCVVPTLPLHLVITPRATWSAAIGHVKAKIEARLDDAEDDPEGDAWPEPAPIPIAEIMALKNATRAHAMKCPDCGRVGSLVSCASDGPPYGPFRRVKCLAAGCTFEMESRP